MAEVSVIIPTYNHAGYVGQAIESVLVQTFSDFELVVVDDGSTDGTRQVLAGSSDPRVRCVWQPNAGLPAARNRGLRESTAPAVAFLDADDLFLPGALGVLDGYLRGHPEVGMVVGGVQVVDQAGRVQGKTVTQPAGLDLPGLLLDNPLAVGSMLLRRAWLERVGPFDESLRACEDWDLWLRLSAAGCRFACVETAVLAYRIHWGQMTGESARMRTAMLAVLDKFFGRPDLTAALVALRDQSRAAALVRAAGRAYHTREYESAASDVLEAVRLDPSLAEARYRRLVGLLAGWADHPHSGRPAPGDYLRRVSEHLPSSLAGLRRELRRAGAAALLGPLFQGCRLTRRLQRSALLRAVWLDPTWLRNRGVRRMVVDTLLPGERGRQHY